MADTFKKFFETDVTFSQLEGQAEVTLASTAASTTAVIKQVITSGGSSAMGTPKLMLDNVAVADLNVGGQVSGNQIVPENTTIKIKGGTDMGNKGSANLNFAASNYSAGNDIRYGRWEADSKEVFLENPTATSPINNFLQYTIAEGYHITDTTMLDIDRDSSSNLYIYIKNAATGSQLHNVSIDGNGNLGSGEAVFDGDKYVYIVYGDKIIRFDCVTYEQTTLVTHTQSFTDQGGVAGSGIRITICQGMGQTPYLVTYLDRDNQSRIHLFNLSTNTLETANVNNGDGILESTLGIYITSRYMQINGLALSNGNLQICLHVGGAYDYNDNRNARFVEITPSTFSISAGLLSFVGSVTNFPLVTQSYVYGGYSFFTDTSGNAFAFFVSKSGGSPYGRPYYAPYNQNTHTLDFTSGAQIQAWSFSLSPQNGREYMRAAFHLVDNTAFPIKVAGYGIEST